MDKEVDRLMEGQKTFRTDLDILEDWVMDVKMSTKGAYMMMAPLKEDVQDLNDTVANLSNQLEMVCVEDVAWCRSQISALEKPTTLPTNPFGCLSTSSLVRSRISKIRSPPFKPG
jgi:hypothetical protein